MVGCALVGIGKGELCLKYKYEEKQAVVVGGLLAEYERGRRKAKDDNGQMLDQFEEENGLYIRKLCHSVSNTKYNQRKNIEKRFIKAVRMDSAIFLTLTFTDEVLSKTNAETRRKYVQRFLKSECEIYVANIDFGDKNGREHYHALVYAFEGSISLKKWHIYGGIKAERVHNTDKDGEKVSKYLAKLSQHALKKSGRFPRLIWSRGWEDVTVCSSDGCPF